MVNGETCAGGDCVCGALPCDPDESCCPGASGGICVDLATDADHCGACAVACDPGHTCVAGRCPECATAADCAANEICANGACGPECATAADCAANEICVNGACGPECATAADCAPHEICISGACGPECATAADCAPNEICISGVCGPECATAADCAPNEICISGVCGPCTANADCAGGEECRNGLCIPGSCTVPDGYSACAVTTSGASFGYTGEGEYIDTCSTDAQCAPLCSPDPSRYGCLCLAGVTRGGNAHVRYPQGRCFGLWVEQSPAPECMFDFDCDYDEVCNDGECRPRFGYP